MMHLEEHELVDAYYGDLGEDGKQHLTDCLECQRALAELADFLEGVRETPVPARNDSYGREVWARLQPKLAAKKHRLHSWIFAPAMAALLALAFVAGMLTTRDRSAGRQNAGISTEDRQRVLTAAIGDHLDRCEILLAELLHGTPAEMSLDDERGRARDLVDENRLLRQTAARSGDEAHAVLLDDLERVLLDLANTPGRLSPEDVRELRERVEKQGLLFKVRVSSTDAHAQGRTL